MRHFWGCIAALCAFVPQAYAHPDLGDVRKFEICTQLSTVFILVDKGLQNRRLFAESPEKTYLAENATKHLTEAFDISKNHHYTYTVVGGPAGLASLKDAERGYNNGLEGLIRYHSMCNNCLDSEFSVTKQSSKGVNLAAACRKDFKEGY